MPYDLIKPKLDLLGIEFQPSDKYYSKCPKCGDSRSKDSKSLMVTHDEGYVRYQCLHEGQCEYNTRQFFKIHAKSVVVFCPPEKPDNKGVYYEYKDSNNNILHLINRLEFKDGSKSFRAFTYHSPGGYICEGYKGKSLYGAEQLANSQYVLVVEGEKACDAAREKLAGKNITVVTWPGGAAGVARGDWSLLKDKAVCIWPDNDEPGQTAAKKIAELLPNVKIVDVSSYPKKFDLADEISTDEILAAMKAAPKVAKAVGGYSADAFLQSIQNYRTGLRCYFSEDEHQDTHLPQSGLVVIGGRTGHFKSGLMIQMLTNYLNTTDKKLCFYSLEIPANRMLLRLLMNIEGETLGPTPALNMKAYVDRIKAGTLGAWDRVGPLLGNRLIIKDGSVGIGDLDVPQDSIVFVDYIQLLTSKNTNSRYSEIKSFADSLRALANSTGSVIVTGSQLTNGETVYQDSVREGKDISNAAELEIKVWNKLAARAQGATKEGKDHYDDTPGNLVVSIIKNRNGCTGQRYGFDQVDGTRLIKPNFVELVTDEGELNEF